MSELLYEVKKEYIEERFHVGKGEIARRKYLKGEFLGKGGFAKCYEVTNC
jgi:polo-like kinase 1